jgi:hypothetical protein
MDKASIIEIIESIINESADIKTANKNWVLSKQILFQYAGKESQFYLSMLKRENDSGNNFFIDSKSYWIQEIMGSFLQYLKTGLDNGLPIEKKAELDTLSRILDQAGLLIDNTTVHHAVIAVIIGSALEDFLRCWVRDIGKLDEIKGDGSIEKYKQILYSNQCIEKPEMKDIEAIAARRNEAAHGNWDKVGSREMVILGYEHVKLFIKKRNFIGNL